MISRSAFLAGRATDRELMGETIATIAAALDTAVRASSPGTTLDEALALRRQGRAQLDVAARLLFHLRRAGAMIGQPAAAGMASSGTTPAAAGLIPEEAING